MLNLHFLTTSFMAGIIWFVQLVHYPTFRWIDSDKFQGSMKHHQLFTTVVVGPMMLLELATAIALLFTHLPSALVWINLLGILVLWALTYFVSVPSHEKLLSGFNEKNIASLIRSNWIRTFLWSLRVLLVFYLVSLGSEC